MKMVDNEIIQLILKMLQRKKITISSVHRTYLGYETLGLTMVSKNFSKCNTVWNVILNVMLQLGYKAPLPHPIYIFCKWLAFIKALNTIILINWMKLYSEPLHYGNSHI